MSGKRICLGSLIVSLACVGMLRGQETLPGPRPAPSPYASPGVPPADGYTPEGAGPVGPVGPVQGSRWIAYPRSPGCCGPFGGSGPIGSELYLRSGLAFPVGGGIFGDALSTGWVIEGGARVLLFDPSATRAWTVDLGLRNVNHNDSREQPITLFNVQIPDGQGGTNTIPQAIPTLNGYNQTFVNLSVGRVWYLLAPACGGPPVHKNLRVGFDAGGRYGSAKVEFNEIPHRDDVVGAAFLAGFVDVEWPCGCCTFLGGLRTEYNYSWSDILQNQNDADLQTITLLFNLGVRY